ncbi:MAG TPA: hypothetical protein VN668_16020 [Stellaceae bacterium]|nr:hypothetical protein [Stellaceae bacterium]
MSAYRCFVIGFDGHIRAADIVYCADDTAAAGEARQLLQRHPAAPQLEIWHLDRRVGVLTRQTLDAA